MRCAVLGSPIAHSLSPVMHRAAYERLGLDWTYDAVEVDEDALEGFLAGTFGEGWRGLSCTMPLKRRAMDLVDEVSATAREVGGLNTILREDDGRLVGDNTDVPGAVAALAERGVDDVRSVRVLGGGATATSVTYALAQRGLTSVELVVRDPRRAEDTAAVARRAGLDVTVRSFGEPFVRRTDLLVSTVPSAAVQHDVHDLVDASRALFDVVYDPWPTPLARAAHERGVPVVSGLDLLAHQAAVQVRLMTGRDVDAAFLRDAALGRLGAEA